MKRNIWILYWDGQAKGLNYGWWIYRDAVKKGLSKIVSPPKWMLNEMVVDWHDSVIRESSCVDLAWYPVYLFEKRIKKQEDYVILINEYHPCLKNIAFLECLNKKRNVRLVLTVRNMMKNKKNPMAGHISLENAKKYFDLIVTVEPKDARLFDLCYNPNPFDNMYRNKSFPIKWDICFCGANKGRFSLLKDICKRLERNNLNYDFRIVGEGRESKKKGMYYVEWQPYPEIVKQDLQSNCVLEIVQQGQGGFTLRTQEAICCNKKLLTNNKEILNSPYYDKRFIRVFESVDDIDVDFIKEREEVQYNYDNGFSSVVFIEFILDKLNGLLPNM